MVEDEKIKTSVSPFSVREGEIKTFDGKDGYVSINQIINKINIGHITDIHFKILELVNKFEFITSRQLYQILEKNGEEVKSQDKLNNKLDQLVKCKILTRYYFTAEEGNGIYRIYCLEKMGKYLLNSRGIECKWQPTDNTKPVSMIKKRLAGNQIIISYLRKSSTMVDYKVKPAITAKQAGKMFKCHAEVKISKSNKNIYLIFEVVRREEDWSKVLEERMKLYNDFYSNFVQMDSGFETKPQLVLVCEDDKHMVETFKIIVEKNLEIPGIKLCFTTDLKQNQTTLEKTLIEFKLDETTKKYKIEELEMKVLN